MNKWWWKIVCIVLLLYTLTAGFGLLWKNDIPRLSFLQETIRNLYFHVCMWFAMMILFTISVVHAVRFLRTNDLKYDIRSREYAGVGILFGLLGYATGIIWLSYTWVDPNRPAYESFGAIAKEPKLIGAAIALLIYLPTSCCAIPFTTSTKEPGSVRYITYLLLHFYFPPSGSYHDFYPACILADRVARRETPLWISRTWHPRCAWYFIRR